MKNIAIRLLILSNVVVLIVAARPRKPPVLTVSEIVVVDAKGVVRARLGTDLPDAVFEGKPVRRNTHPAGLILYDDSGQERGGYVTHSNGLIALTLDSRKPYQQIATLVGAPTGESALMLNWQANIVEMRSDTELGPSIHAKRDKHVVFHAPPTSSIENTEMCSELRSALKKTPREQVIEWCRQRTSEEACQSCLSVQ